MARFVVAGVSLAALACVATAVLSITDVSAARAHCQVPCGIYDDQARITILREDATTIAKAVDQINLLAGKHEAQALNQATRWITTKEAHATHIITVVAEYFLTQKVKPVSPGGAAYDAYLKKLADHHAVMVMAMKTKQNSDASYVSSLRSAIDALAVHYR